MASLNKHTREQFARSIATKEPVCLLGPPRSGLSGFVASLVKGREGDTRSTSAKNLSRAEDLWPAFTPTGAPPGPETPFNAKVVVAGRGIALITNLHLLRDDLLRHVLLVCAEANVTRDPDAGLAVVLEGAIDSDRISKLAEAHGIPYVPRRIGAEAPHNSDISGLVQDELWRKGVPSTWAEKAAIADLCGSDIGFAYDFLDALQAGQPLTHASLRDASNEVVRFGRTAGAIRQHIAQLDDAAFEVLLRLSCGQIIVGAEPISIGDSTLARLFYRGLASYFVDLRAYACRSVLTARTVLNSARASGRPEVPACTTGRTDIAPHSIAQLQSALGWTACLEAALHAYLRYLESRAETKPLIEKLLTEARSVDAEAETINKNVTAAIRKNLAVPGAPQPADAAELEKLVLKSVSEAVPKKQPLVAVAAARGCSNAKDTISYLTLSETISVLDEVLKQTPTAVASRPRLVGALDEFRTIRNTLAHLRPLVLETATQITSLSQKAYMLLNTIEGIAQT